MKVPSKKICALTAIIAAFAPCYTHSSYYTQPISDGPLQITRVYSFAEQVLFVATAYNLPSLAQCALWLGASPHEMHDVNFRHLKTPLIEAASIGSADVIHVLCNAGADANEATSSGKTPLMAACASGNLTAVQALLDHNANVSAVAYAFIPNSDDPHTNTVTATRRPYTALTIALQKKDTKMVQLLFNYGAKAQGTQLEQANSLQAIQHQKLNQN